MKIFTNVIASPVWAKQSIFGRLVFALVFACIFIACGDESSSSVSPEPRQCEEQSEDCDDTSSSSGEVSKDSSSSVDGDKSSSSVKKEDSSSSAVKASSSSAAPNSSSSE